eukprot:TRINITY_DN10295_c0_g1_i1.p1 TRINITY_DN10295_c0_g1~~TRINITY_DN10295_c0_g1_i1.p1  ORF type:complete len:223 (-),score=20.78 TRINITY_DN10295_c0_g1_i1:4-672(-)
MRRSLCRVGLLTWRNSVRNTILTKNITAPYFISTHIKCAGDDVFSVTAEEIRRAHLEKRYKNDFLNAEDAPKRDQVLILNRRNIPASVKRITPRLKRLRGLSAQEASIQLQFAPTKAEQLVKKFLDYGIARAEKILELDTERLLLVELYATRGKKGPKKIFYRSRGRHGIMQREHSHVRLVLREVAYNEKDILTTKFARRKNSAFWRMKKAQKEYIQKGGVV